MAGEVAHEQVAWNLLRLGGARCRERAGVVDDRFAVEQSLSLGALCLRSHSAEK